MLGHLAGTEIVNSLTNILIWASSLARLRLSWWQGQIRRFTVYMQETREELRKCTWPTWDELKGSTVVITISIVLLGGFIVLVDQMFFRCSCSSNSK